MSIPKSPDNVGPAYWTERDQAALSEKIKAAEEAEVVRRRLVAGIADQQTLAYARFLASVENDATLSHGQFKWFGCTDDEVVRKWPFLAEEIAKEQSK